MQDIFAKLSRFIKRQFSRIWRFRYWFTDYPRIWLKMTIAKRQNQKIITYHLSSPGHVQYHLPTFLSLKAKSPHIQFFIAEDYPMGDKLAAFNLPASQFFPASLAQYLPQIDAFIEGETHGRGPKQAVKIFTGHGYPTKRAKWSPQDLAAFDYYFLYGPLEKELFGEIQKQHPTLSKKLKTIEVGYPKLDRVLNGSYNKGVILEQMGLDKNKPTILYAPAWDPGGAVRTFGLKVPEIILQLPNINLIVKLHPANLEPSYSPNFEFYTGGVDWRLAFKKLNHHTNFRFVEQYSINPLLVASDLMITDFSGVALEFMTQNKPVIFIHCPEFYQKTLAQEGCDAELAQHDDRFNGGRNAGMVVEDLNLLLENIQRALKAPAINETKRKELTQRFLYNPGAASEVEANKIIELIQ